MQGKNDFQKLQAELYWIIMKRKVLAYSAAVILILAVFASCRKDPDPLPKKIVSYYLLCPAGKSGCYTNCGTANDTNGNSIIDPAELPAFNSCTSLCDVHCDLSFLFLYLN